MNKDFLYGTVFGVITAWLLVVSFVGGGVCGVLAFLNQDATARYNVKVYK